MTTEPSQPSDDSSGDARHALVVGSDEVAQTLLEELSGVRVSPCEGLGDSMDILRDDRPDLVVCSLDGDGWQLTPLIRKAQNWKVPVLAVASDEEALSAVRAARWAVERTALLSIVEVAEMLLEDPGFVPDPERYPPPRRSRATASGAAPPAAEPAPREDASPSSPPAGGGAAVPASWLPSSVSKPAAAETSSEEIADLRSQLSQLEVSAQSAKQWSVKRMEDNGRRLEEAGRRIEILEEKLASLGRVSVLESQLAVLSERIQELAAQGRGELAESLADQVQQLAEALRQNKGRMDSLETSALRGEQQRREWEEAESARAQMLEERVRRIEAILLATEQATREQSAAIERFSSAVLSRIEALESLFAASERRRLDRVNPAPSASAPVMPEPAAPAPQAPEPGNNGTRIMTPVAREGSGRASLPPPGVQQRAVEDYQGETDIDLGAGLHRIPAGDATPAAAATPAVTATPAVAGDGDSETLRQLRESLAKLQDAWAGVGSDKKNGA